MLSRTIQSRRTWLRCAGAVAGLTAGLFLALASPAPAQAAPAYAQPSDAELAHDARSAPVAGGGLATPGSAPQAVVEIDLFRAFTDCLAEAAHGDSMYPGIDPAEVNACLADYGL